MLPIAQATINANIGTAKTAAQIQTAYVSQVVATILPKLGKQELAMICTANADRLVQEAGNAAACVSIQRTTAHALLSNGQYDDALTVIDYTVTSTPSRDDRPELLSVLGTLHLVGAMTSARTADREGARSHLVYASAAAQRLGRDANYFWTAFGPTNVCIHEVSVAAELGDYQRAASLGTTFDVLHMPTERQVRHRLEVARTQHYQHHVPEAIDLLLEAERIAPDQVHGHFLTHSLVHARLRTSKITPTRNSIGSPKRQASSRRDLRPVGLQRDR